MDDTARLPGSLSRLGVVMSNVGRFRLSPRRRRQLLEVMGLWAANKSKPSAADSVSTEGSRMNPAWTERCGPVTVLHVGADDGSLRTHELDELRNLMLRCATEADPPDLLIDLEETNFFGGEFLGLLCQCYHEINGRRGHFALCDVRPELRNELHAAKLDALWNVYATRDEAVEAMEEKELSPVP